MARRQEAVTDPNNGSPQMIDAMKARYLVTRGAAIFELLSTERGHYLCTQTYTLLFGGSRDPVSPC